MVNYSEEQAFEHFIDNLAEHIQSPDALILEAQYRLNYLVDLTQSGEWIQDSSGNIIPVSLPQSEQLKITENCAYSIIDEVPKITEGYTCEVNLFAFGSIVSNVTIAVIYPDLPNVTLQFDQSHIIETRIEFK